MLQELHVKDLALIEDVWLEFGSGMTVLTGETGAGKTALVGALKLLLGERADSGAVRAGAREALVEGCFLIGESDVVARRRVGSDGRSKCTLDGEMTTVGALADVLGPLVDLHGQHDHQALLSPSTHVTYLDRWAAASITTPLTVYREALGAYRDALRAHEELRSRASEALRQSDYLRFIVGEIDAVAPVPGEDDALRTRLPGLRHAEQLTAVASAAHAALHADGGAEDAVGRSLAALQRAQGLDPALDALADQLKEAAAVLEDAAAGVRAYRDAIEHDPAALDEVESRLAALSGIERKYGPGLDTVIRTRDEAAASLEAAEAGEEGLERARQRVEAAEAQLKAAAHALQAARTAAAPEFAAEVTASAADLSMSGARFEVAFSELPFDSWTVDGPQRVEFLFAASPSAPARPLARIASGGEISRVMLALKGVLGQADDVPVLVFDEVDAGIGGATAHAVGRRLAQLARTHQVIVVTHLAQVAVHADAHLVVRKDVDATSAVTAVDRVDGDARTSEIARMLSGADTDASRAHARELLETAVGGATG